MSTTSPGRVWAMALLREDACTASAPEIRNNLLRHLPESEIYFPALTLSGALAWDHALSGYVFVGAHEGAFVNRLQRSRFVEEVVRSADRSRFELLTDAQMDEVRQAARPRMLKTGHIVRVLSGECLGMVGRIMKIFRSEDRAEVLIRLHSRHITISVSLHELERP